jgi:hypothetical protein
MTIVDVSVADYDVIKEISRGGSSTIYGPGNDLSTDRWPSRCCPRLTAGRGKHSFSGSARRLAGYPDTRGS